MSAERASSNQRSERVRKRRTTPAATAPPTSRAVREGASRTVPVARPPVPSRAAGGGARRGGATDDTRQGYATTPRGGRDRLAGGADSHPGCSGYPPGPRRIATGEHRHMPPPPGEHEDAPQKGQPDVVIIGAGPA